MSQFDQARLTINAWVSSETGDKINNLLPEGSLDDTTRMVLVNAIHLKLPWSSPFDVGATAPASFTTGAAAKVSTPFMNQTATLPYVDDGKAQIVGLPLSNNQVAVVLALPHGDLATYEAGLAAGSAGITMPTTSAYVQLSVPKVSFTSPTFSLANALTKMGMPQAFDPKLADFKGLCTAPPDGDNLYISDVLQKAMVAMQETGVEAAAATAVIVSGASCLDAAASDPDPDDREPPLRPLDRRRPHRRDALPRAHRRSDPGGRHLRTNARPGSGPAQRQDVARVAHDADAVVDEVRGP